MFRCSFKCHPALLNSRRRRRGRSIASLARERGRYAWEAATGTFLRYSGSHLLVLNPGHRNDRVLINQEESLRYSQRHTALQQGLGFIGCLEQFYILPLRAFDPLPDLLVFIKLVLCWVEKSYPDESNPPMWLIMDCRPRCCRRRRREDAGCGWYYGFDGQSVTAPAEFTNVDAFGLL